jgi:hypothetical protein
MNDGLWQEVDLDRRPAWRRAFNDDWSGANLAAPCPVCSKNTLHRWYVVESDRAVTLRGQAFVGHGRLWEWCSNCHTYEYYPDGYVPDWWKPPYSVDPSLLRYDPGPIEQARAANEGHD